MILITEKFLKVYLIVEIPMTICTMIAGYTGVITNLVYHRGEQVRMSFGFVYPTDFGKQVLFFMVTAWVVLRQVRCTWIEIGLMIISVVLFEKYCDVRNSEIVMMILIICVVYLKIRNKLGCKERKRIYAITITKNFMSGGTIWVGWIYDLSIKILSTRYRMDGKIKYSFSTRLSLGKEVFDRYDIQIWGQDIPMRGNGGSTEVVADYFFIDSSYVNILMRLGLVAFIFGYADYFNYNDQSLNHPYMLMAMAIVCIHSVMEHHMFEVYYDVFFDASACEV